MEQNIKKIATLAFLLISNNAYALSLSDDAI